MSGSGALVSRDLFGVLPRSLADMTAVAVALFDRDGTLLAGNRGFRLAAGDARRADAVLVNPTWDELRAAVPAPEGQPAYRGLLNLGFDDPHTLQGAVYRDGAGRVLLVAERRVVEMDALATRLRELTDSLAGHERRLLRLNRELRRREAELATLAVTDPLTKLPNRRQMDERLAEEVARSRRHDRPMCLAMADIDRFKRINDGHGHDVGDRVIVAVARCLAKGMRAVDRVGRYGGEEFLILLPDTPLADAASAMERLAAAVRDLRVPGSGEPVTASFGVAGLWADEDAAQLRRRADQALYAAKRDGRDRVAVAD